MKEKNSVQHTLLAFLVVMLPLIACRASSSESRDAGEPNAANSADIKAQLEEEKKKLPEPVFNLFYAVKDSLDYGVAVGKPPIPEDLSDFQGVTDRLLNEVQSEWEIISYQAVGDDYELIIQKRGEPLNRFRATRNKKFKWREGQWQDLGGYLYF